MQPITGFSNKLYYNSATHASPTWVLVGQCGDLDLDLMRQMGAAFIRESLYEFNEAAGISATVNFQLLYNAGNTAFDALRTMFFATGTSNKKEFFIADGLAATVGTQGFRAYMTMERFPWKQPLQGINMIDQISLKLAYFEVSSARQDPDWYTVSS